MANFSVTFERYPDNNLIMLCFQTQYASARVPITSTKKLIKEINEACGKGSYLRYHKNKLLSNGTRAHSGDGNIGYAQQGFKTHVIEQAFFAAKDVIRDFDYNIEEWTEMFYSWHK